MSETGGLERFDRRPPPFIYDLVPQGQGRKFLLGKLGLTDSESMVMPLVMAGAFNPIGNLRLRSALEFYEEQVMLNPSENALGGLTLEDICSRSHPFTEHISLHSMLAAGTTGVQGVAPKFLLAKDADGLWHADLSLADDKALSHWLVKLPRGGAAADQSVLRNEAAYLRLAGLCGLRASRASLLAENMLFAERFDRRVAVHDGDIHLTRLPQESLGSVAGLRGFAPAASQNDLLHALRAVATDREGETLEFLKRDVLNLAMRNTDNHARNTAVQRLPDGSIQLTPVYDFAPMFLDPEVIARSLHWRDHAGVRLNHWSRVVASLGLPAREQACVVEELGQFAQTVSELPRLAAQAGVEPEVIAACSPAILEQARQLSDIVALEADGRRPPPAVRTKRG